MAHLRFEMLISDVAARCPGAVPRHVDVEVDRALEKILEFSDANIRALLRINQEAIEGSVS